MDRAPSADHVRLLPHKARSGKSVSSPVLSKAAPYLTVPVTSPVPLRLAAAYDEFGLRASPSRGSTASPGPRMGVRRRLVKYQTFDDAVDLLKKSKNIVVLTGAGISTSTGIPDFRSDKGLYAQLSRELGITTAEEFFGMDFFLDHTEDFYEHVKRVIPESFLGPSGFFRAVNPQVAPTDTNIHVPQFSPTHAFLSFLQSKHKLLTNYTQNIDGLEVAAGLSPEKFIQCHGSWETATCMTCSKEVAARKYLPIVFNDQVPFCKCTFEPPPKKIKKKKKSSGKPGKKRKRPDYEGETDDSSDEIDWDTPRGLLKPDITFFGERITGFYDERLNSDKFKVDLFIIIGTSLKVGPIHQMLTTFPAHVPQIYISKERFSGAQCGLPGVSVDIELLGECDVIVQELCRRAGWATELEKWFWEENQLQIKGKDHAAKGKTVAKRQELASAKRIKVSPDGKENKLQLEKLGEAVDDDPCEGLSKPHPTQTTITVCSTEIVTNSATNTTHPDSLKNQQTKATTTTTVEKKEPNSDTPSHKFLTQTSTTITNPPPPQQQPEYQLQSLSQSSTKSKSTNLSRLFDTDSSDSTSEGENEFDPDEAIRRYRLSSHLDDSPVKIEHVEGTASQWRVTRRM